VCQTKANPVAAELLFAVGKRLAHRCRDYMAFARRFSPMLRAGNRWAHHCPPRAFDLKTSLAIPKGLDFSSRRRIPRLPLCIAAGLSYRFLKWVFKRCPANVRHHPNSGAKADIPPLLMCAKQRHEQSHRRLLRRSRKRSSRFDTLASSLVAAAAFPGWHVKLALIGPDCPAPKFCAGGGTLRLSTPRRP
jgi:hypothetical protein